MINVFNSLISTGSSMRKSVVFIIAALSIFIFAEGARAELVSISGTHSLGEIKGTCDKVGGTFQVHPDGGGYGCAKDCKGGTCQVACTNDGKCNGQVPHKPRVGKWAQPPIGDLKAVLSNEMGGKSSDSGMGGKTLEPGKSFGGRDTKSR